MRHGSTLFQEEVSETHRGRKDGSHSRPPQEDAENQLAPLAEGGNLKFEQALKEWMLLQGFPINKNKTPAGEGGSFVWLFLGCNYGSGRRRLWRRVNANNHKFQ